MPLPYEMIFKNIQVSTKVTFDKFLKLDLIFSQQSHTLRPYSFAYSWYFVGTMPALSTEEQTINFY